MFTDEFDLWDPITGLVLPYPFIQIPDIARRARGVLESRSKEQITSAALLLDQIIDDWVENAPANAPRTRGELTDFEILKACFHEYTIRDDEDGLQGRAPEYFAVFALWKLANVMIEDERRYGPTLTALGMSWKDVPSGSNLEIRMAANRALEAMEAICLAELLIDHDIMMHEQDELRAALNQSSKRLAEVELRKESISASAKRAASKRHAENHELRQQALEYYKLNLTRFTSIEAAAQAIAGAIVPVRARTVALWISDYRRSLRNAAKAAN